MPRAMPCSGIPLPLLRAASWRPAPPTLLWGEGSGTLREASITMQNTMPPFHTFTAVDMTHRSVVHKV
eukprot:1651186-Rhodomonas_salina.2